MALASPLTAGCMSKVKSARSGVSLGRTLPKPSPQLERRYSASSCSSKETQLWPCGSGGGAPTAGDAAATDLSGGVVLVPV